MVDIPIRKREIKEEDKVSMYQFRFHLTRGPRLMCSTANKGVIKMLQGRNPKFYYLFYGSLRHKYVPNIIVRNDNSICTGILTFCVEY